MQFDALFAKYKNVLYVGIAVLLIGGATYYLMQDSGEAGRSAAPSSVDTQRAARIAQLEQELLSRLSELQSIQLNDDIFSNLAFQSLIDFHQPILDQCLGRDNPFAPIELSIEDIEQQILDCETIVEDEQEETVEGADDTTPARRAPAPSPVPPPGDAGAEEDAASSADTSDSETATDSSSPPNTTEEESPPAPPPSEGPDAGEEEPTDGGGASDGGLAPPPPPPPPAPGGL